MPVRKICMNVNEPIVLNYYITINTRFIIIKLEKKHCFERRKQMI